MKHLIKSILYFSVLLFFFPSIAAGQEIAGFIENKQTGQPLEAVTIVLKPGGYGTTTNRDGYFKLNKIPLGKYKMTVSMIGFEPKAMVVNNLNHRNRVINMSLSPASENIDEVEVLGNHNQQQLLKDPDLEQVSLLSTITSVSSSDIRKQGATTLSDALKYVPGGWTETRGRKVKQFFSVRGQKYPYPTYSINGIWQKEFAEMPYLFNSLNIEEVKIIRSGSALLKSLSALAGVIDVKTKIPKKKATNIYLKYGTLNTYQGGVAVENATSKLKYRLALNRLGTAGPAGRNGKENIWNANSFVQYQFNNRLNLSVNLFYLTGMRQLVQPVAPADSKFINRKEEYKPIRSLMVSTKLNYKPNDIYSSEFQMNYSGRNLSYRNENLSNNKVEKFDETDFELTLNQLNALALGRENTIRFGCLYNYWIAPNGKRFYYGRKGEVHTFSGVVTDQHNFGRLLLDAGFRLTQEYFAQWAGFGIEGSGGKFKKVAPVINEWQPPVWQATSGLSFALSASTSLQFSCAAGVVNPRNGALTNNGETPANETRFNYDFGIIKNMPRAGKLVITPFLIVRKNAIDYSGKTIENSKGDIMELYSNESKHNFGVEVELKSIPIINQLTGMANFTFMKGEINRNSQWQRDDEMPYYIANFSLNYVKQKVDINAFLNYVGAYKNDRFVSKTYLSDFGKAPLGNFTTIDVTAGYEIDQKQHAKIYIEGKNLFDNKYQTVPGYPDNGRMVSAGISLVI